VVRKAAPAKRAVKAAAPPPPEPAAAAPARKAAAKKETPARRTAKTTPPPAKKATPPRKRAPSPRRGAGPVEKSVHREMHAAALLDTAHAQTALALARDVDEADSAGPRAVAARELRLQLDRARAVGNPLSPRSPGGNTRGEGDGTVVGPEVLRDMRETSRARVQGAAGKR
jgi:hypothetical protein